MGLGNSYKITKFAGIACIGLVLVFIFKRKRKKFLWSCIRQKIIEKLRSSNGGTSVMKSEDFVIESTIPSAENLGNNDFEGVSQNVQLTIIKNKFQTSHNVQTVTGVVNSNQQTMHCDRSNIVVQGDNNTTGSIDLNLRSKSSEDNLEESNLQCNNAKSGQSGNNAEADECGNDANSGQCGNNSEADECGNNPDIAESGSKMESGQSTEIAESGSKTESGQSGNNAHTAAASDNNAEITAESDNKTESSQNSNELEPRDIVNHQNELQVHPAATCNNMGQEENELNSTISATKNLTNADNRGKASPEVGRGFLYLHKDNIEYCRRELDGQALHCNRHVNTIITPVDNMNIGSDCLKL